MNLIEMVKAMPADEQRGAIAALDACTRPLTAREVERALRRAGVPYQRAVKTASALRGIAIIVIASEASA